MIKGRVGMAQRGVVTGVLALLALLIFGPGPNGNIGVTVAKAQSLRSIVRRITGPISRNRTRTRKTKSRRNQQPSKNRPAATAIAPPAPPVANPRRLKQAAAAGVVATTSATATAAAPSGKAPAHEPKPDVAKTDAAEPDAATSQPVTAQPPAPDTWSETEIVAALKACVKLLAPHDVDARPSPAIRSGRCGDPAPVLLKRIGQGAKAVTFKPAVTLNCAMAARFIEWLEGEAQPVALATYGARIKRISGANGYACRNRNGAKTGRLSEHALGNAIDIPTFELTNGRKVSVLSAWGRIARANRQSEPKATERKPAPEVAVAAEPPTLPLRNPVRRGRSIAEARAIIKASFQPVAAAREAAVKATAGPKRPKRDETTLTFLKDLHASACKMFGTVLGPDANRAHEDHFHFDLAPRRRSAYCR
jgi:hypothetical protein